MKSISYAYFNCHKWPILVYDISWGTCGNKKNSFIFNDKCWQMFHSGYYPQPRQLVYIQKDFVRFRYYFHANVCLWLNPYAPALDLCSPNGKVSSQQIATLWRHNEHDGVSNHQLHDCLLDRLFKRRSKKTSSAGIRRWPVNSLHRWPVTRKMFPFDDVVMIGCWNSWLLCSSVTVTSIKFRSDQIAL